jgi:hypothetical protein
MFVEVDELLTKQLSPSVTLIVLGDAPDTSICANVSDAMIVLSAESVMGVDDKAFMMLFMKLGAVIRFRLSVGTPFQKIISLAAATVVATVNSFVFRP